VVGVGVHLGSRVVGCGGLDDEEGRRLDLRGVVDPVKGR
jgi:hypothetical protein